MSYLQKHLNSDSIIDWTIGIQIDGFKAHIFFNQQSKFHCHIRSLNDVLWGDLAAVQDFQ